MRSKLFSAAAVISIISVTSVFVGCRPAAQSYFPAGAENADSAPAADSPACRIHMQFTSSASALAPGLARPMSLAGLAGQMASLHALVIGTEQALKNASPSDTEAYRKSLLAAQGALAESLADLSRVPEDVKTAVKRATLARDAATRFAKGRTDGSDIVLKAAETDLGSRELESSRAVEVATRLEEAAKIRQGAAPLTTYAASLRELAKASETWGTKAHTEQAQAALTELFRATATFGTRCSNDLGRFAGTASARPEDLRKRAIIISNVPTASCVESAKRLFPNMPDDGMGGHGTGFIVYRGKEPLIVTNRHVVAGAGRLEARHADGSQLPPVRLTYVSREHDIAVLSFEKIDASIGEGMAFAAEDPPELAPVIAAGFPGLLGRASFQLTRGHVSNAKLLLPDGARDVVFLQHTAVVDPGSSGGPLVNERGEVVGINTRKATEREAVSFAIPGTIVRSIVSEAGERLAKRSAKVAWLLAVDAIQRGPEALEPLVSQDLRTKAPVAKTEVIEALHHANISPCDVMKAGALSAEFAELAQAGKPGPIELCESLTEKADKAGALTAVLQLPKGTATLELREDARGGGGYKVSAFHVEKSKR